MGLPTATVRLRGPDDMERTATGMGTGPVDASYKAIDALVHVPVRWPPHHACFAGQRCFVSCSMQHQRCRPGLLQQQVLCQLLPGTPGTAAVQAPPSLSTPLVCSGEPFLLDMATSTPWVGKGHALQTS